MARRFGKPARQVRPFGAARWCVALTLAASSVGCGNEVYAVKASSAWRKIEEARELGAEKYAPYEYFYAKEHLEKAQTEAAEADYGDAIDLADASSDYADKAVQLTRDAHRGAGR